MKPELTESIPVHGSYDLAATLSLFALGRGDPCVRIDSEHVVRCALSTRQGAAALRLTREPETLRVELVGDDLEWLQPRLPAALGLSFTPPILEGPHRLRALAHRLAGLRLLKLPVLFPRIVQLILQQLVTFQDACHGWRSLVQRYGIAVDDDLYLPPTPAVLARLASYQFVECGILPQHGRRIRGLARLADRIETLWGVGDSPDAINQTSDYLLHQRGIGPWTVGDLRGSAMGDDDAIVIGDYGFPKHVAYFFEGREEADDDEMLRILEPYQPHRFYVLSLLIKGTKPPPRRAPRHRLLRHRLLRDRLRAPHH